MICATLVRALVLSAAFAGALTPMRCLSEDGNQSPENATKELSPELLSLLRQKKMSKRSPIILRVFKEEAELEIWKQDVTGHFQILKPIRSVGGRAISGRNCARATVKLRKASIRSRRN